MIVDVKTFVENHGKDSRIVLQINCPAAKVFSSTHIPLDEVQQNPIAYLGYAKDALVSAATKTAQMQKKLIDHDYMDNFNALQRFSKGYAVSSFRTISPETATLVYGKEYLPGQPAIVELEPASILIGKGSTKELATFEDSVSDFVNADPNAANISAGTKLIIESFQEAHKIIEQQFKDLTISAQPLANPFLPLPPLELEPKTQIILHNTEPGPQYREYVNKIIDAQRKNQAVANWPGKIGINTEKVDALLKSIKSGNAIVVPNDPPVGGPVDLKDYVDTLSDTGTAVVFAGEDGKPGKIVPLSYSRVTAKSGNLSTIFGDFDIDNAIPIDDGGAELASSRSENSKNPRYWAHAVEDKVNGIRQQVMQNLPEGDETRDLICAISDLLSDHIHNMGTEASAP